MTFHFRVDWVGKAGPRICSPSCQGPPIRPTGGAELQHAKGSAVWAVASWFSRPPLVVFLLRGLRLEGERHGARVLVLWVMELSPREAPHVTVSVSEGLRREPSSCIFGMQRKAVVLGSGSSNGVDTKRFTPITPAERLAASAPSVWTPPPSSLAIVGRFAETRASTIFWTR